MPPSPPSHFRPRHTAHHPRFASKAELFAAAKARTGPFDFGYTRMDKALRRLQARLEAHSEVGGGSGFRVLGLWGATGAPYGAASVG